MTELSHIYSPDLLRELKINLCKARALDCPRIPPLSTLFPPRYIYLSIVKITQSCLTLVTPWTVAHKIPLSMGFSRQEYWSALPFSSPVYIYIYMCVCVCVCVYVCVCVFTRDIKHKEECQYLNLYYTSLLNS